MEALADTLGIDLAESWAYSDSATDVPMLAAVGHPVAVNPDRELLRVARERGWAVRWFVRPVRLRDRIPRPAPASTVAVGGGMVAAVAAAVTWWWLRRTVEPPAPTPSPGPSWRQPWRDRRAGAGAGASSWAERSHDVGRRLRERLAAAAP
jgi:hypothetical protein